jgi:hypothetical protein
VAVAITKEWLPFDPDGNSHAFLSAKTKRRAWWNVAEHCGVPHFRGCRKAGWRLVHVEVHRYSR